RHAKTAARITAAEIWKYSAKRGGSATLFAGTLRTACNDSECADTKVDGRRPVRPRVRRPGDAYARSRRGLQRLSGARAAKRGAELAGGDAGVRTAGRARLGRIAVQNHARWKRAAWLSDPHSFVF